MKQVTPINSAPKLPNWPAAAEHMRAGGAFDALCALLGVQQGSQPEMHAAVLAALEAQPNPAISIYDRRYTAHIYPEPGVAEGQVYEALRDYAAPRATEDPAMREIKRQQMLALLDKWQAEGPPSAEDDAFWRDFQSDLAKTKRGDYTEAAGELAKQLAEAKQDAALAMKNFAEEQTARLKALEYSFGLERKLAEAEKRIAELEADLERVRAEAMELG